MHNWHDFERQVDVLGDSVGHHIEDTIRWDEGDRPVSVEPAQSNALVKLDVVDLDSFVRDLSRVGRSSLIVGLHQQLVVDAELTLRHPRELCFDSHAPIYVRFKDSASV